MEGLEYTGVVGKLIKIYKRDGVKEILFDKLKKNTKKLKCFGLLSFFKNNVFKCILLEIIIN